MRGIRSMLELGKVQEEAKTVESRPWWSVASGARWTASREGSKRSIKRLLTFQGKVQSIA